MIKPWLNAIRVHTLPAGAIPALLGITLAKYQYFTIDYPIAFLTVITCLLLQISSNLINDYYDGIRGVDNSERIGFTRATATGAIKPSSVKRAFCITLALAFVFGMILSYKGGIFIFAIGILSLLFAYLYTGGPFPLSYYALGELFAFIFFGPIAVIGSNYLQTNTFNYLALTVGLIPGFISAAIMAINNLRDSKQDKEAGKTTLANLLGEKGAKAIVIFFLLMANTAILYLANYNSYIYLAIIPLFLFINNWLKIINSPINESLNLRLKNTGKYLTLTGLILGIIFSI